MIGSCWKLEKDGVAVYSKVIDKIKDKGFQVFSFREEKMETFYLVDLEAVLDFKDKQTEVWLSELESAWLEYIGVVHQ